jgi:hypothetical protein
MIVLAVEDEENDEVAFVEVGERGYRAKGEGKEDLGGAGAQPADQDEELLEETIL